MSTVQEMYCLKDVRNNFEIYAERDADFYVPRCNVDIVTITKQLRNDLITDRCPKRYVNGPYGAGKTHTLYAVTSALKKALLTTPTTLKLYMFLRLIFQEMHDSSIYMPIF